MDLKKSAFKAVRWNLSGSAISTIFNLIVSVVLARLLTPSDYGVVAIGLTLLSLSLLFINGGFGAAIIQSQYKSEHTLSSIFYFNLIVGVTLSIFILICARWISDSIGIQELHVVLVWFSPLFLINALNVVPATLFQRDLNIDVLVKVELVASILGSFLGIAAAFLGFGYKSLLIQHLSTSFIYSIFLWLSTKWLPRLSFSLIRLRVLARFGKFIIFESLTSTLLNRIDVLIIGKVFNAQTLGIYTKPVGLRDQLVNVTSSGFRRVFFPILSTVRTDAKAFSNYYLTSLSVISIIVHGVAGVGYLFSRELILGLFGEQWVDSIRIFGVIILTFPSILISSLYINGMLSLGLSRLNFWFGLFRKTGVLLALSVLYMRSVLEYLWVLVVFSFIATYIGLLLLSRNSFISFISQLRASLRGLIPLICVVSINEVIGLDEFVERLWLLGFYILAILVVSYRDKGLVVKVVKGVFNRF